jgi:hypothetical protein
MQPAGTVWPFSGLKLVSPWLNHICTHRQCIVGLWYGVSWSYVTVDWGCCYLCAVYPWLSIYGAYGLWLIHMPFGGGGSFCNCGMPFKFAQSSVHLSVCLKQSKNHWTDFHEIWYCRILQNIIKLFQFSFRSDNCNDLLTLQWRRRFKYPIYTVLHRSVPDTEAGTEGLTWSPC